MSGAALRSVMRAAFVEGLDRFLSGLCKVPTRCAFINLLYEDYSSAEAEERPTIPQSFTSGGMSKVGRRGIDVRACLRGTSWDASHISRTLSAVPHGRRLPPRRPVRLMVYGTTGPTTRRPADRS